MYNYKFALRPSLPVLGWLNSLKLTGYVMHQQV